MICGSLRCVNNDDFPHGSRDAHSPQLGQYTRLCVGSDAELSAAPGSRQSCSTAGVRVYSLAHGVLRELRKSKAPQRGTTKDCNPLGLGSQPAGVPHGRAQAQSCPPGAGQTQPRLRRLSWRGTVSQPGPQIFMT